MHDPGGKSKFALRPGVYGAAFISDDGVYRTWLSRVWGSPPLRYALFIGANPSEAKADVDDPTVIREVNFCQDWGYNGYCKVNLADYRSTDPKRLASEFIEPRSADNATTICKLAKRADKIVLAYGAVIPQLQVFADELIIMLRGRGHQLWCLGTTKNGNPKHPLYLARTTQLVEFGK